MERGLVDSAYELREEIEAFVRRGMEARECIFDLSFLSQLQAFKEDRLKNESRLKRIWIPDTISVIMKRAERDPQYYYYLTRLIARWTQQPVDLNVLKDAVTMKSIGRVEVKVITEEMVDKDVHAFCLKEFWSSNLKVEFSPPYNIFGDVIGKIIGSAKRLEIPILMTNRRLAIEIRKVIPVFDAANAFVDAKTDFFERYIPVRRTRGTRWFLGLAIGALVSPIGIILAVLDP